MKRKISITILIIMLILCFTLVLGCTPEQKKSINDALQKITVTAGNSTTFTPSNLTATNESPIVFAVDTYNNYCPNSDLPIASIDEKGTIQTYGAGVISFTATKGEAVEQYAIIIVPKKSNLTVTVNSRISLNFIGNSEIVDSKNIVKNNGDGTYTPQDTGSFEVKVYQNGFYIELYTYTVS